MILNFIQKIKMASFTLNHNVAAASYSQTFILKSFNAGLKLEEAGACVLTAHVSQ